MEDSNRENNEVNDWRNEHGEPDFAYLQSLKKDGSVEALEKLQSIASDLDVDFNPTTPADELVESIILATKKNEDGNQGVTN